MLSMFGSDIPDRYTELFGSTTLLVRHSEGTQSLQATAALSDTLDILARSRNAPETQPATSDNLP